MARKAKKRRYSRSAGSDAGSAGSDATAVTAFSPLPTSTRDLAERVTFRLRPVDDFAYYDETRKAFAVEPGLYELGVGASSRDIRQRVRVRVR